MRLRLLGVVLLLLSISIIAAPPPARAQAPGEAEIEALNDRVVELYQAGKYSEAIPLAERYAAAMKARHGENAPEYAEAINNLAQLLKATNRLAEAEPLMRRALAIDEKAYGTDHPDVAIRLNNLALLREEQNDWAGGAVLCLRAKPIMTGGRAAAETESRALTKAVLSQNTWNLRNCARAHYRTGPAAHLGEGFDLAQWAL